MKETFRRISPWLVTVLVLAFLLVACETDDDEEDEDDYESVAIEVVTDQLYDLAIGEQIGIVRFRQKKGATGARVEGICSLESLSRFPDQRVDVRLELLNQDAARDEWEPVEWVQDTNEHTFYFIIPLVETIPVILNFRLLVYQYIYAGDDEYTLDDDTTADDDTTDDDTGDDDTGDDDSTDDDTGDDDVTDDDTGDDDDDDDTAPEPDKTFEAEAVYLFIVNEGQPGTGD